MAIASALLSGLPAFAAEPVLSVQSANAGSALLRVRTLFTSGKVDLALEQAKALVQANPDDAPSLALLGDVFFRESRFTEAERAYREAVQADSSYARGHWGLGRIDMLTSRRDSARAHIATAFRLNPRDPDIVLGYAGFMPDPHARSVLLQNFLTLSRGDADRELREDAAAQLEITERLGTLEQRRLVSPYQNYRLKLAGYFPGGGVERGLLLQVSLDGGKPLRLILDSGADGIFVNGTRARTVNVKRLVPDHIAGVGSVDHSGGYLALARHVATGGLELENCLVHVSDTASFPNADGAIGLNVFEKFLVRLDPASRTLDLVPFTADSEPGFVSKAAVPSYRVNHFLLVNGAVDGQPGQYFLLDTGASFSATPGAGDSGTPEGAELDVRGAEGRVDGVFRALPMRLAVGGQKLVDEKPVKLDLKALSRHEGVEISGIIGYPLLAKSVLTISYRDGLIDFGKSVFKK